MPIDPRHSYSNTTTHAPRLEALAEAIEEPHGKEGTDANEHGVLVGVRGDVLEEVRQLVDLHRVARQLLGR